MPPESLQAALDALSPGETLKVYTKEPILLLKNGDVYKSPGIYGADDSSRRYDGIDVEINLRSPDELTLTPPLHWREVAVDGLPTVEGLYHVYMHGGGRYTVTAEWAAVPEEYGDKGFDWDDCSDGRYSVYGVTHYLGPIVAPEVL